MEYKTKKYGFDVALQFECNFPLPKSYIQQVKKGFSPKMDDNTEYLASILVNNCVLHISFCAGSYVNEQGFSYFGDDMVSIADDSYGECVFIHRDGSVWYFNNERFYNIFEDNGCEEDREFSDMEPDELIFNPRFGVKVAETFDEFTKYVFAYSCEPDTDKIGSMKNKKYNGMTLEEFRKVYPYQIKM